MQAKIGKYMANQGTLESKKEVNIYYARIVNLEINMYLRAHI